MRGRELRDAPAAAQSHSPTALIFSPLQEQLILRAAVPEAGRVRMVANFPLGAPAFRDRPRAPWSLTPRSDAGAPPGSWALGDGGPGGASHASTREDGLAGGGYFLVARDGDGGATVVPVDEWHTFRPPVRWERRREEERRRWGRRARSRLPDPTTPSLLFFPATKP